MPKLSSIEKNSKRKKMAQAYKNKRELLKSKIYDKNISISERFELILKLAKLPRNSASNRIRRRCELTGRPRSVIRKFGLSRNMIRQLGGQGLIPGLIKASW